LWFIKIKSFLSNKSSILRSLVWCSMLYKIKKKGTHMQQQCKRQRDASTGTKRPYSKELREVMQAVKHHIAFFFYFFLYPCCDSRTHMCMYTVYLLYTKEDISYHNMLCTELQSQHGFSFTSTRERQTSLTTSSSVKNRNSIEGIIFIYLFISTKVYTKST
jgi:hypothetical protein